MIRKILFLLPLVASIFATSCKDEETLKPFSISPQDITFKAGGETAYVSVYGDQENWKMWIGEEGKDKWCSFNESFTEFTKNGKGRTEAIPLYAKPNPNRTKLTDTLYLEDLSGRYGIIKVKLTSADIGLVFNTINNDSLYYIPAAQQEYRLKMASNADAGLVTWNLPANVTAGFNEQDTTVIFIFTANDNAKPRVSNLTLTGAWKEPVKSITLNLTFIQDGVTSRATDSTTLVTLNNRYGLGWNTSEPMTKWKGIVVSPIECSEGLVNRLTALDLQKKNIAGALPTEISDLCYLRSLRLNENQFSGSIPDSYYQLTYLELLYLGHNALTGTLNNSLISSWENMQTLSIVYTSMSGEIPANLSLLKSLKTLELNNNEFTGGLPVDLGKSKLLTTLTVSNNYLTLPIPNSYRNNIN
ncbi:MAG: hypothetical protein RR550_04100, partial [Rikenellaceae bacterium]